MVQLIDKPHKIGLKLAAHSLASYLVWYEGWLDAYHEASPYSDMVLVRRNLLRTATLVVQTKKDIKERMGLI